MEQPVIIREAGEADVPAVAALHNDMYAGFEAESHYMPFALAEDALETLIAMQIKSKLCFVMVAEAAGEIVGFYTGSMSRIERKFKMEGLMGYLNDLYLKPAYRKKGYANKLLLAAQAWLARNGVTVIKTDVLIANNNPVRLLESQGFAPMAVTYYKQLQE